MLQPDHTPRAIRAAIGIRSAIQSLNREIIPDSRRSFGIGIHEGEAVLGLVDTEKRLDYTAIGNCVNTAKRIQENVAPGQILISQRVYDRIKWQVKVSEIEQIREKGNVSQ